MYTQCPQCDTVFRISATDLGVAHGEVRCGQCNTTFNALVSLSEAPPPGAPQPHFSNTDRGAEGAVPAELIDAAVESGLHDREHEATSAFISAGHAEDSATADEAEPQPDCWSTLADDGQGVVLATTPAERFATDKESGEQDQREPPLDDEASVATGDIERPFEQPAVADSTDSETGFGASETFASATNADEQDEISRDAAAQNDEYEDCGHEDDAGDHAFGDAHTENEDSGEDSDDKDDADDVQSDDGATGNDSDDDEEAGEDHGTDDADNQLAAQTSATEQTGAESDEPSEIDPAGEPGALADDAASADVAGAATASDRAHDELPPSDTSAARPAPTESDSGAETNADTDEAGNEAGADPRRDAQDMRADMADLQRYLEPPRRLWVSIGWGSLGIVAAIALIAQFAHHWRHELIHHEAIGPLLQQAYDRAGISLQPDWDIEAYRLVARPDVASVEGEEGQPARLRITAALENQAERAQPLPLVRVTLEDRWGSAIATRNFLATEYSRQPSNDAMLAPGERMRIDLRVVDPGGASVGYTIDLCLPTPGEGIRCAGDGGG